jgi:RND superfamily putative drug exporter
LNESTKDRTARAFERPALGLLRLSVRYPFRILLIWLLLGVIGLWGARGLSKVITNTFDPPPSAESARVDRVMAERFRGMASPHLLLVLHPAGRAVPSPSAFSSYEGQLKVRVRAVPGVEQVLTPRDLHVRFDQPAGSDLMVIPFKASAAPDDMVVTVRRAIAQLPPPAGVAHELTDMPAISYDTYRHTAGELAKVERVGLILSALVLVYVFGGLFPACLPLLTGVWCITLNNGLLALIARFMPTGTTNQFITAIVGLAIGIDYPLFLLSRVREELKAGVAPAIAFERAVGTSGKAIAFSGAIVAVSALCLGLLDVSGLRPAALSVGAIVLTALALCYSFIPALVFAVGRFVPIERLLAHHFKLPGGSHLWDRLIAFVVDRPKRHLALAATLLAVLTVPVLGARFWSPTVSMLPKGLESIRGLTRLSQAKQSGQLAPIYLTVTAPTAGGAYRPAFVHGLYDLVQDLERDPRVGQVVSMVSFEPGWSYGQYQAFFNNPMMRTNRQLSMLVDTARGGQTALVRIVPRGLPDAESTRELVRDLRGRIVPSHLTALNGAAVDVGGEQAKMQDIAHAFTERLPLIGLLNLVAITLILAYYFRSVFLPIKAIVMNLLPLVSAFGVVITVFQYGVGARWIGLQAPGFVMLMTPAILLTVLFALSMDYEIIILSRIREAFDRTGDHRASILEGLGESGKVIVGAAAIMFSVFLAYLFADLTPMKEVGLGLATAILIDATLVRLVVLPATMRLMGRWNYWLPSWPKRAIARLGLTT